MMRSTVAHNVYDVVLYRTQRAQAQRVVITTPGTRISWSSVAEWMMAWKRLNARAPTMKRHGQRAAHIAALASNMDVINSETNIETLAAATFFVECEQMQPPRGEREGHPATEILQRLGTVLNERRRAAGKPGVGIHTHKTNWKAAA
ncbi:hypothetical protein LGM58_35930 [Burkholderia contaminans]|uniref:hypothetical protein n=1 Tax=Burkholderia contaminans TaxID=488447 RepID=UPI001CF22229|nr:hypothetical protein [Burkholderia contaminans]MCA7888575.1 hypothetical protein [Burkholderia contaminans]